VTKEKQEDEECAMMISSTDGAQAQRCIVVGGQWLHYWFVNTDPNYQNMMN
jgi:hypothetical protein